MQGKERAALWEAAPRRLRLGCRRLRGCLRGRLAQIGVRGGATGPPDDGQREAAHLAPHLLARSGFHRNRLLLRGETVVRPFAGCDQLAPTSTEFLGFFLSRPFDNYSDPLRDNGFRWQLGNSQDSEPGCNVLSNEQRASRRGRRAEPVPQVCLCLERSFQGSTPTNGCPLVGRASAHPAGGLAGQGPRCLPGPGRRTSVPS